MYPSPPSPGHVRLHHIQRRRHRHNRVNRVAAFHHYAHPRQRSQRMRRSDHASPACHRRAMNDSFGRKGHRFSPCNWFLRSLFLDYISLMRSGSTELRIRNDSALFSARHRTRRANLSLLTPHSSSLSPRFMGGRAYSALPCAGAPPPQRPLSYNLPPQRVCGQYDLGDPLSARAYPPRLGRLPNMCQRRARQARQRPSYPQRSPP